MRILKSDKGKYVKNFTKSIDKPALYSHNIELITKELVTYNELKKQRIINEINRNKKKELYNYIQKRKQDKINTELNKLRFYDLASRNNITQAELERIKQLNNLNIKTLQKIAQQHNINTTGLNKKTLIYTLIRSEVSHKENQYLKYLNNNSDNEIFNKINDIRIQFVVVSSYLKKHELNQIRKRLHEIEQKTNVKRSEKTKLLNELTEMSTTLKCSKKNMISDYRDDNYANLQDVEYIFGDSDNYYKSTLVQGLFNKNYQRYYIRGDKTREMPIDQYIDKVIPFLKILINDKKMNEQKIQLDMGINLVHITDNKRITFFSKSENIRSLPSSNTNEILNMLLASFYKNYQEDILLCRTSSSFVFESVEELNIHFHKVDLQRGATYMPTPEWIKNEKATINVQNTKDSYCSMYAATIALYHKELGSNPEHISKILLEHIPLLNWHNLEFPVSFSDYVIFEKLNEDITLNIYVPYEQKTICSEYISSRNHTAKKQITLLKITDNNEKWHFLALRSMQADDGCLHPIKSFSRLMSGISSENHHGDFYCYGCFRSYRTQSVLNKHIELCKNNNFCQLELPKKGKNYIRHKPGSKSLKMNYMIYSDFETILVPYQTCDNKDVIIDSMCLMNESLSNLVDNLSDLYTCKCLDETNQDIKVTWKEKKVHIHRILYIIAKKQG